MTTSTTPEWSLRVKMKDGTLKVFPGPIMMRAFLEAFLKSKGFKNRIRNHMFEWALFANQLHEQPFYHSGLNMTVLHVLHWGKEWTPRTRFGKPKIDMPRLQLSFSS